MPAPTLTTSALRPPRTGSRLPWWALALPAAVFAALLSLAASAAGSPRAPRLPHEASPLVVQLLEVLVRL